MYDNIVLRWMQCDIPSVDFMEMVPPRLSNLSRYERQNGNVCVIGELGVFRVYVTITKVKLDKGSLCKYQKGNNCDTLTLEETKEALLSIGERLGLPIEKAIVGRIDFSTNLEMNYPPSDYFSLLGTYPGRKRLEQPNGIYFKNKQSNLLFYGKVEECKDKGYLLPEEYRGKNLLRIELRLMKRVPVQLKMEKIHANDLYNPRFFLHLLTYWHKSYKSVVKVYQGGGNLDAETTKALIEQLASIGVLGLRLDSVLEIIKRNL